MIKKKKIQKLLVLVLTALVFLVWQIINYSKDEFRIVFFDVGQGDSALINFPDNSKMLIDCGSDADILSKLNQYLPFFDNVIDYMVISHFDLDHYGGCIDVLKRYQVKNIIINDQVKYDEYFKSWEYYLEEENAQVNIITQTSTIEIASTTIEFLYPFALATSTKMSSNNQSIIMKITYNSHKILFTGDMEVGLEGLLVNKYCVQGYYCAKLSSTILKVGHHGSSDSTSDELLEAIDPQSVIISVGNNSFGHPSMRVINKLERRGIEIRRTDEEGDVIIK